MHEPKPINVQGNLSVSVFRAHQNKILKEDVATLPHVKKVLNIGGKQNESDKEGNLYRAYFPHTEYFTLDKNRYEDHPCHFNIGLEDLSSITDHKFDLILIMSVLEHVEKPWEIFSQLRKIMSDNAYLFISVPFFYPLHKDELSRFSDYWRFTDDGIRILCAGFEELWIKSLDSVILSVYDRKTYWDFPSTLSGYCALFKNKPLADARPFVLEKSPEVNIQRRQYASYNDYLQHQGEKLEIAYDKIKKSDEAYEEVLFQRFQSQPYVFEQKNVLCLGARLGGEVRAFKRLGALALGIDINPGHNNQDVLYGDIHHIAFPNEIFDYIYCNILDHILNLSEFCKEVSRVLRSNGILFMECAYAKVVPGRYEVIDTTNLQPIIALFEKFFTLQNSFVVENKTTFINWTGMLLVFQKKNLNAKINGQEV